MASRWWGSLRHLRGEWLAIALSSGLSSLAAAGEAAGLVLIITLANTLAEGGSASIKPEVGPVEVRLSFSAGVIAAAVLVVGSLITRVGASYVLAKKEAGLMKSWRKRIVGGFLISRYEFQARQRAGDLIEAVGHHSRQAAGLFAMVANLLNALLSMIILVGVAFVVDPIAASVLIGGGTLLLGALRPASKRTRTLAAQEADFDVMFGNQIDEVVEVARDIKLFRADELFARRTDRIADQTAYTQQRVILLGRSVPQFFQAIGLLILLAVLAIATLRTDVNVAALAGAAILLYRGLAYGQQISGFQQQLARYGPYVHRLTQVVESFTQHSEDFGSLPLDRVGAVEIEDVSYRYEKGDAPAIRGANVTIKEPGIIGFVGPSGSGKSTLAQLLLRLRTPTRGRILVNGIDTQEYDSDSWHRGVAFVPQEASLVHGTVAENISYFRDWLTKSEIEEAARAVGLTAHIESLPKGFETPIGPTVREFSGGQRQRIGIARALAGNPSLVVLDEPTSALDSESEEWVMRTLGLLRESSIVIVITHRDTTLRYCDAILRFQSGQVFTNDTGL